MLGRDSCPLTLVIPTTMTLPSVLFATLLVHLALASPVRRWPTPPPIDLGYAVVQGYVNEATSLTRWNGIKYAEAGRFEAAHVPATNRTTRVASDFGPICYQSNEGQQPLPGGNATVASPRATTGASEDCLFLKWVAAGRRFDDAR